MSSRVVGRPILRLWCDYHISLLKHTMCKSIYTVHSKNWTTLQNNYVRQIILLLEHYGDAELKSNTRFLRKSTVELAQ